MLPSDLYQISLEKPLKLRTIWLSDVHLGNKGCEADHLLTFLRCTETEYLYLAGDIIDIWSMRRNLYWPQKHNDVVRTILGKPKHGTRVTFIPGNHDEKLRDFCTLTLGNIVFRKKAVHTTATGKRMLVLHGDELDSVIRANRFLGKIGALAYGVLLRMNIILNWVRRKFGMGYWSLAGFLKYRVKNAVKHISNYENAVTRQAKRHKVDAVVCGHIHHPELTPLNSLLYCNCGDWVESCSALVETLDGTIALLSWNDERKVLRQFPVSEWNKLAQETMDATAIVPEYI